METLALRFLGDSVDRIKEFIKTLPPDEVQSLPELSEDLVHVLCGSDEEKAEVDRPSKKSQETQRQLSIDKLGWSVTDSQETWIRLRSFEEDWNSPGMEAYDDL
ncbi:MAG: hypothetical protein HQK60_15195 [Deltaproteobacteria bacterium]|nr:hypothetical protein [Deltaproteobacteria bacterium]